MESLAILAIGVYLLLPVLIVTALVVFMFKTVKRRDDK
jgi:hypothetical protein